MSWDDLMEKFGNHETIGLSASWVKDNLLKSFIESNNLKTTFVEPTVAPEIKKRGRGRPKGSKNKKTLEKEKLEKSLDSEEEVPKIEFNLTNF